MATEVLKNVHVTKNEYNSCEGPNAESAQTKNTDHTTMYGNLYLLNIHKQKYEQAVAHRKSILIRFTWQARDESGILHQWLQACRKWAGV